MPLNDLAIYGVKLKNLLKGSHLSYYCKNHYNRHRKLLCNLEVSNIKRETIEMNGK